MRKIISVNTNVSTRKKRPNSTSPNHSISLCYPRKSVSLLFKIKQKSSVIKRYTFEESESAMNFSQFLSISA